MSVYKRKGSPYWQYDFIRNGVRFCGSSGKKSRREAKAVERQKKREAEAGTTTTASAVTLDVCFARYWDEHVVHLASRNTMQHHINRLLERLGKNTDITELSTAQISEYVAVRRAEVSSSTVVCELSSLRSMHRMAGEVWEMPTRAIAWRRLTPKPAPPRTRWISRDEADRLFDALPEHLALAAEWSLLTGCRKMETFGLVWARVDLPKRYVEVWGKSQCWQSVELSDQAMLLLANLPGERTSKVFCQRNVEALWVKACAEAGLHDFRWHDLRHTYATWLRQAGVRIETIKELLRHADIGTTMRYAHVERSELREAVQKVPSKVTSLINNM